MQQENEDWVGSAQIHRRRKTMPKDMKGVMKEFKQGKLHSGSKKGPVVKDRKQAIAIGLSEAQKREKRLKGKIIG